MHNTLSIRLRELRAAKSRNVLYVAKTRYMSPKRVKQQESVILRNNGEMGGGS